MAGSFPPGPTCGLTCPAGDLHDGTMCLQPTPVPGADQAARQAAWLEMEQAIDQLQVAANQFARVAIHEDGVRQGYLREMAAMCQRLLREVRDGVVTPREGAYTAGQLRNDIVEAMRLRSTPVGRAWAERLKAEGKTLESLLDHYAGERFRRPFSALAEESERNAVFLEVVKASGRDRPWVAPALSRAAKVGRGLVIVSLGFAVYEVATADDKLRAAGHEASALGGGMLGGIAGAAVAGLACGPGAPVCVLAIVFVSGAVAAWGAGAGFDWLSSR